MMGDELRVVSDGCGQMKNIFKVDQNGDRTKEKPDMYPPDTYP